MVNGNCKRWVRGMGSQAVKAQHRLTEEDRLAGLSTEGGKPGGGQAAELTPLPDPARTSRLRNRDSEGINLISILIRKAVQYLINLRPKIFNSTNGRQ